MNVINSRGCNLSQQKMNKINGIVFSNTQLLMNYRDLVQSYNRNIGGSKTKHIHKYKKNKNTRRKL